MDSPAWERKWVLPEPAPPRSKISFRIRNPNKKIVRVRLHSLKKIVFRQDNFSAGGGPRGRESKRGLAGCGRGFAALYCGGDAESDSAFIRAPRGSFFLPRVSHAPTF